MSNLFELPPESTWKNTTTVYGGGAFVDVGFSPTAVGVIVWAGIVLVSYVTGPAIPYSKFNNKETWNAAMGGSKNEHLFAKQTDGKKGFMIAYVPALVMYPAVFAVLSVNNYSQYGTFSASPIYSITLLAMWVFHFSKRIIEVQCVHKFSGTMPTYLIAIIATAYASYGVQNLLCSNLVEGYDIGPESPTLVMDVVGMALWVVGLVANTFFHLQLKWSRSKREEGSDGKLTYLRPEQIGIFFKWFTCPHYLAEGLEFIGYSIINGTIASYLVTLAILWYFGSRTYQTHKWYVSKGLIGGNVEEIEVHQAREGGLLLKSEDDENQEA